MTSFHIQPFLFENLPVKPAFPVCSSFQLASNLEEELSCILPDSASKNSRWTLEAPLFLRLSLIDQILERTSIRLPLPFPMLTTCFLLPQKELSPSPSYANERRQLVSLPQSFSVSTTQWGIYPLGEGFLP